MIDFITVLSNIEQKADEILWYPIFLQFNSGFCHVLYVYVIIGILRTFSYSFFTPQYLVKNLQGYQLSGHGEISFFFNRMWLGLRQFSVNWLGSWKFLI
jgi:hypothetical protein